MIRCTPLLPSLFLLLPAACQGPTGSDPNSLVQELRNFEATENYAPVYHHLSPGSESVTLFILWFGAAYRAIGADAEVVAAYQGIVQSHGLDENALSERADGPGGVRPIAEAALKAVDRPALFADLIAFQKAHGKYGYAFGFLEGDAGPAHVQGDLATVQVGTNTFHLARVDGRWFWQLLPPTP